MPSVAPTWIGNGRWPAIGLATAVALLAVSWAPAQTAPGPVSRELEQRLARPVTALWSDVPLRTVLDALAEAHGIALLLDRRVDPEQPVAVALRATPLGEVFERLAEDHGLGTSRYGAVLYLGPPPAARRLRTQAVLALDAVNELPAARRPPWRARRRLAWDDFAEPRTVLAELAAQEGVRLVGVPQTVPHDLWAAADLPPLTLVERITLIAVQYDLALQFSSDGTAARLVPVPDHLAWERSYPGGRQPAALAEQWQALVPGSQIRVDGRQIVVRGPVEDHEQLFSDRRPAPTTPDESAAAPPVEHIRLQRFRIQLQPVGPIIEEVGRQLGLAVQFDQAAIAAAGISLAQRVSVEVENVSVDGLLEAILDGTGLSFTREGAAVSIHPSGVGVAPP